MKIRLYVCVLACVLAFFIMAPSMVSSQQNASKLQSVDGVVSAVDSVGSILVVLVGNEQVRFIVDKKAIIQRGTDTIFLDDINQSDSVTLRYYVSADGTPIATSIVDSNLSNDF